MFGQLKLQSNIADDKLIYVPGTFWLIFKLIRKTKRIFGLSLYSNSSSKGREKYSAATTVLARVVRKVDNVIRRINHYPANSAVCFVNAYSLDSNLSGG